MSQNNCFKTVSRFLSSFFFSNSRFSSVTNKHPAYKIKFINCNHLSRLIENIYAAFLISIFISIFIDFLIDTTYTNIERGDFMNSIRSAIENTIPISQFNRGLAGKIFDEVKQYGAKVVMKNNTAECVLLSPDEYIRLMDEINDARLMASATERMSHFNPDTIIPQKQVDQEMGFQPADYENAEDIEFE